MALAAAVAVADLSSVQHGFWVVLGTLSVLRTNASATGATALRALLGTVIGFVIGGALLIAIGTSTVALWIVLPVAVLIASYAPGTAPFAVGQAGFTITVAVLFNLLVPVGWKVGELRVVDVAIGCLVSVVVGVLFWPRGSRRWWATTWLMPTAPARHTCARRSPGCAATVPRRRRAPDPR